MEKTGDFYDLLGVQQTASGDEIRAKYHELARLFHPDRVPEKDKEIAHRVFVRINQAYSTLIDVERRQSYDQRLAAKRAAVGQAQGKHPANPAQAPAPSREELQQWITAAGEAYLKGDLALAHEYCRKIIKSGKAPLEIYVLIGD